MIDNFLFKCLSKFKFIDLWGFGVLGFWGFGVILEYRITVCYSVFG